MGKRREYYIEHPAAYFIDEALWDSCVEPQDNSPMLGGRQPETNGREPMLGGERRPRPPAAEIVGMIERHFPLTPGEVRIVRALAALGYGFSVIEDEHNPDIIVGVRLTGEA